MDQLTNRQRAVALLVLKGMSNREIARKLGITRGTVKVHLHTMFRVLDVFSRFELAIKLMGERHASEGRHLFSI